MLLRHWSLFESINNSTYMMAKLNLWKEPGQKSLRDFLLQIGIPLDQAKQKFSFMDPELKSELTDRIRKKAETFGLGEILQHSFVRQYDSKTQFSSHDMAYSVSSLLEHPNISGESGLKSENKQPNAQTDQKQSAVSSYEQLLQNFWVAYDALEQNSHSKLALIYKGIEQTKEMQQAIMRVGNAILDQREVKQMKQFNYVFIENSFLKDIQLFQYPLSLSKLGLFILQARKARLKSEKAQKPLILSVRNPEKKKTLVIAVFGPDQANSRNTFG